MEFPVPIPDVITLEEEQTLLQNIADENITVKSVVGDRYLIRYGHSVYPNYIKSKIIPNYLLELSDKLINLGILAEAPSSVTVNVYKPGCYIKPHVDDLRAGPVITIVSIKADAEMELSLGRAKHRILLPTRSVIQLKDEYRNGWKHSIPRITQERISIVFRQENISNQ